MAESNEQVPVQTSENTPSEGEGDYKVVMIGATGATGKYLFAELVKDKRFSKITAIGRRPASIPEDAEGASEINLEQEVQSGRVEQINDVDLNKELNKETVGKHLEGKDIFFSAFGTSRKQAGSAAEFRRIDQGINTDMAKVAREMDIPYYGLMSSYGANSNSWFLYLQVKGQLDDHATALGFDKTAIWRPGTLNRGANNVRFGEKVMGLFMNLICVKNVAKAMVKDAVNRLRSSKEEDKGTKIYANADIYAFNGLNNNGKPPK